MTTILTQGTPGIASFGSDAVLSADEVRFGEGAATTTICTVGASVDLPIYSVVSYDGTTIALAGLSDAYGILTAPVKTGVGGSSSVAVYRSGHFNMDALNWDAAYTTDALKKVAFESSVSPTIFISKPAFDSANIDI